MTTKPFQIYSYAGDDYGVWDGVCPADALATLHREAGYDVKAVDGELVFADPIEGRLCGALDAWEVKEAEAADA